MKNLMNETTGNLKLISYKGSCVAFLHLEILIYLESNFCYLI